MKQVFIILAAFFTFINVDAKSLKANKEVAKVGEDVLVSIDFDSDKVALDYDKNVFEEINKDSFTIANDEVSFKDNTFYFSKGTQESLKVMLKVKEEAVSQDTVIKVTHDGIVDKINVQIEGKSLQNSFVWVIPGLLSLGIAIFILCYFIKNKNHFEAKQISIMIVSGILLIVFVLAAVFLGNRKAVQEIENSEYLIEIADEKDKENEESTDVAITPVEEEKNTNQSNLPRGNIKKSEMTYQASVRNYLSNTYIVKKGEKIVITFYADVNPHKDISAVEINGMVYPVSKVGDKYEVVIKADGGYGKRSYTITSVILNNGRRVGVSKSAAYVYILKEEPIVENIKINSREDIPVLTFNVKDTENAFVSGTAIVRVKNPLTKYNNEAEILHAIDVKVGENRYSLAKLAEGTDYDIIITLEYDLDEDKKNTNYASELVKEETGNFEREYHFKLVDAQYPEKVDENANLTFTFKNGDYSYKDVTEVTIDGTSYPVTKTEDGVYHLDRDLPKCTKKGKCTFTVERVKIVQETEKEKIIEVNQTFNYIYMKNDPTITEFSAVLNGDTLSGTYAITDLDNTITGGKVILTQNDKEYVYDLTKEQLTTSSFIVDSIDVEKAGNYDVSLVVNYDLGDNKIQSLKKEAESPVRKAISAKIIDVTGNEEMVKRGTEIDLIYTIKSNTDEEITNITINDIVIKGDKLEKQADGTYKVTVTVPEIGEGLTRTFKVTKMTYGSEEITLEEPREDSVNIFKLTPKITAFTTMYDQNNITGTFTLTDTEDAITGGQFIIKGPDGQKEIFLTKEEIKSSSVTKPLALEKAGKYTVILEITYAGTENDGSVQKESDVTITKNIVASVTKVVANPEIVSRGGTVELTYTISDNTDKTISKIKVNNTYLEATEISGKYQVTASVLAEGDTLERTFEATAVIYGVDEEVTLTEKSNKTLQVLKKAPTIDSLTLSAAGGLISGEFNYTDEENAVVGAKYTIGDKTITLSEEDFRAKKFTDETVRNAGSYDVTLTLIYDLGDGSSKEDVTKEEKVQVNVDATIIDAVIESSFVKKGDVVTLTYTVKDNTTSDLSKITINNQDEEVSSLGNDKYQVTITISEDEQAGVKEFKATKLTYVDAEEFTLTEEHIKTVSTTVLKTKPEVSLSEVQYQANNLTGTITVQDNDDAIQSGKLIITGPGFSEAHEIPFTKEEIKAGSFTKPLELPKMGSYQVLLEVTYNLGEKDETLQTKETSITKPLETKIESVKAQKEAVAKDSNIELVYKITDNTDALVSKIKINGEDRSATYDEASDTYKVQLNAGNKSKKLIFATTEVTYADGIGTSSVTTNDVSVYVLKDMPKIKQEPVYSENNITIQVEDTDKAISSGKVVFTKMDTSVPQEVTLSFGEDWTGDIRELTNGIYKVEVKMEYDLDGEELSLDAYSGSITKEYENVAIITDYSSVTVTDLILKQFTDEGKIMLEFTVTNDTTADITEVKIGNKIYSVTKTGDENKYVVTVDKPDDRTELQITEMTFSTGITKTVDVSPKVLVNKTKPTATVTTEISEGKVKATITTIDDDTTITRTYAILKNVDTEEEVEKIQVESNTVSFTKALDGGVRYQVDIASTYDLVDGKTYTEKVIGQSEHIVIDAQIELKNFSFNTPYTHPNYDHFTVKFDFESNVKLSGDIKDFKVHTKEYDGSLKDKDPYQTVGIPEQDDVLSSVSCGESIREGDGVNYKTTCRGNYKVPDKSGVIELRPVSYTYLSETKTIDADIANAQAKLIDITKKTPSFSYKTENDWSAKEVRVKVNITDSDGMLQKYDNGSYVSAKLANKTSSTIIDNLSGEQTIVFDQLDDLKLNTGYRITISVRYDKYHGNIVNSASAEERIESIAMISYVHFITDNSEATLNDIELVDSSGQDIENNEFMQGDDVRLRFVISGEVSSYPEFKPTKIKITTSDTSNMDYQQEYSVTEAEDIYTTTSGLTGLKEGEQDITIVELSDASNTIVPSKDNVIRIKVKNAEVILKDNVKEEDNPETFIEEKEILEDDITKLNDEISSESSDSEKDSNLSSKLSEKYYSTHDTIEVKKDIQTASPGVIWWAEFRCDKRACQGFTKPGSQNKVASVVEGRRADIDSITMKAPEAMDGYQFIGWKKYSVTYQEITIPGFEAIYEISK